ncbi:MAG TPA: hypothetical protein VGM37_19730 [Armatimonadota bacterium]|jgi:hypothetical protein
MKHRAALLALFTACAASQAAAPESLLAAALAGPRRAFQGEQSVSVVTDGGVVRSVVSVIGDGRGRERRQYHGGSSEGITLLRLKGESWQRAYDNWARLPAVPAPSPMGVAKRLVANYRVTVLPPQPMLGRSVIPIRVDARRPTNPSRRMWLDPSSGIIVKDQTYAPNGRLRSESTFVRLNFLRPPAALFKRPSMTQSTSGGYGFGMGFGFSSLTVARNGAEVERITGQPLPRPRYVPKGFAVEVVGQSMGRRGSSPAVRYSDGFASFTIFRRGAPRNGGGGFGGGNTGPSVFSQSTNQHSSIFIRKPAYRYFVIGDIAESELQKVADTLE